MKIKIKTAVYIPDLPGEIDMEDGQTLNDALLQVFSNTHFSREVIDPVSGRIKTDDIWDIRVNNVPFYGLERNLDTKLNDKDTITFSLLLLGGG